MGEPVTCSGPPHGVSPPFLSAPYSGYAELASFFDHDFPDYAVDGKIVTTTGLTAEGAPAAGGFPAYWSSQLRQYIYYDGHNGYDYDISYQPVLAAAPGVVSYAAWESSDPYVGYGQMIVIKHRYGYMTLYGHLSKILVKVGQRVKAGQRIAISGTTGHSTGPHLHFTVYHDCHAVDPYGWNGKGKDPLVAFNGETSTYLWKRGQAPNILDPLPGWPAYRAADSTAADSRTSAPSPAPQAPVLLKNGKPQVLRHLLLLKVPAIKGHKPDSALLLFQRQLTDERRQLVQVLNVLKAQGTVKSYSALPTDGAMRVAGTAPAQELTSLPGVASILGDRPKDEARAAASYSHALTDALRRPPDTSMFPATYLDSQWTWRLTTAAEEGGPYVLGFSRPGASVHAKLVRNGHLVAKGTTAADPKRGAFAVVLLHGRSRPASISPGDVVTVSSGSKSTEIQVVPLQVSADAGRNIINGTAPSGSHLETTAVEALAGKAYRASGNASTPKSKKVPSRFAIPIPGRIIPGDSVSVRLLEASGNTLFYLGRAAGFEATLGSATVHGWAAPGSSWRVDAFARKHWRGGATAVAAPDGYVQAWLRGPKRSSYTLWAGSHLRFRSGGNVTWLGAPRMTGNLHLRASRFTGTAPQDSQVFVHISNERQSSREVVKSTGRRGRYGVKLGQRVDARTSVEVLHRSWSGYVVRKLWADRTVVFHQQKGLIEGHAGPDETMVLRALNKNRQPLGLGVAQTSQSGAFTAYIYRRDGRPATFKPRERVTINDGQVTTAYRVPSFSVRSLSNGSLSGSSGARGRVAALFSVGSNQIGRAVTETDSDGRFLLRPPDVSPPSASMNAELTLRSRQPGAWALDVKVVTPVGAGIAVGSQMLRSAVAG